jgi:hypothetical protein
MTVLAELIRMAEPWAQLYSNTPALQAGTAFAHFGGLLLGGGFAIAADAATVRAARRREPKRRRQLAYIRGIHRVVLVGVSITFVSGLLMFAADGETLAGSVVFWTKMTLVTLLLVNGGVITLIESALRSGAGDVEQGWRRMRNAAIRSFTLWFAAVLAGTLLVNLNQ